MIKPDKIMVLVINDLTSCRLNRMGVGFVYLSLHLGDGNG